MGKEIVTLINLNGRISSAALKIFFLSVDVKLGYTAGK